MQIAFELPGHHASIINMASKVLQDLVVPNMFTPSFPLHSVILTAKGTYADNTYGDGEAHQNLHTSLKAAVIHAIAVMSTGVATLENLLTFELPLDQVHGLVHVTRSMQVLHFQLVVSQLVVSRPWYLLQHRRSCCAFSCSDCLDEAPSCQRCDGLHGSWQKKGTLQWCGAGLGYWRTTATVPIKLRGDGVTNGSRV